MHTSPSHFEAHAGLFRLLVKGTFDAYALWTSDKSFVFELEKRINTQDFTVTQKVHKPEKKPIKSS